MTGGVVRRDGLREACEAFSWRGVDRRGIARAGRFEAESAYDFVEEKWSQGFRSLQVTRGGEVVGEVGQMEGSRKWWAER